MRRALQWAGVVVATALLAVCLYGDVLAYSSWRAAAEQADKAHGEMLSNLDHANKHLAGADDPVRLWIDAEGNAVRVWESGTTTLTK